jgi:hypothetical protein
MNSENTAWLRSRFPSLYRPMFLDRTLVDGPMLPDCFIFECGDGWLALLYRLSRTIATHAKSAGLDPIATQVKEKYGALRVYVESGDEEIERLIDAAEIESTLLCEVCGAPGSLMTAGWWSTRCLLCGSR